MDPQDLLLTALRASLIYFYLLVLIRLLGKRTIGNTSAFDLLVALMLGEVVDEAIFGDVSLVKGMLAIAVIAAWHFINSWASYKNKTIEVLTQGKPSILVLNGAYQEDAMAKEHMSKDDVLMEIRLQGIDELKEVKKATLEPNGQVSVIKEDWAETVQKQDLPKSAQKQEKGKPEDRKPRPAQQA